MEKKCYEVQLEQSNNPEKINVYITCEKLHKSNDYTLMTDNDIVIDFELPIVNISECD